jgi:hypothetical protein
MTTILSDYLSLLWRLFQFDIYVFSHPWMYYLLLIPAVGYLVFFFVKWAVLTAPLWLPISIVLNSLRGRGKK